MDRFIPDGSRPGYFGIYPAIVTGLEDPDSLGRVQVQFPWLSSEGEQDVRAWATLLSPYADNEQGLQVLPEIDSQVVVAFEAGDLRRPYVIGACWNGREAMPAPAEDANNLRVFRTRSNSVLEFDDTQGAPKVTLSTDAGHTLVLDESANEIKVTHSNGSVITFSAAGKIEVQANATVDITASVLNVHAGVANFDGLINCSTLIASSAVVSPSYTPGAGNVW